MDDKAWKEIFNLSKVSLVRRERENVKKKKGDI